MYLCTIIITGILHMVQNFAFLVHGSTAVKINPQNRLSRDERDAPLTQYITNTGISRARYTITDFKTPPSCSMADFQLNECITSLYSAIYARAARRKKIAIWHSSSFFSRPSVVSSDARLHINPLHFLARSAVCLQMSCTSCLSNNNIQTPDQISVPCI